MHVQTYVKCLLFTLLQHFLKLFEINLVVGQIYDFMVIGNFLLCLTLL